ncbi:head decoration protein [Paraburkholderia sp. BR14320]|uniref:head decoration protein n=1 Tax=unclassified Paraburkholderia TaxID=2615204 RepID=UPI0034CDCD63
MAYVSRAPLNEQWHAGGFLVSQPRGNRHIDRGLITGAVKVFPGTIMGQVTATGSWVVCTAAAADGSQNAAGICFGLVDATLNDQRGALVVRDCEVNTAELVWDASMTPALQTTALGLLQKQGIIAR